MTGWALKIYWFIIHVLAFRSDFPDKEWHQDKQIEILSVQKSSLANFNLVDGQYLQRRGGENLKLKKKSLNSFEIRLMEGEL